MAFAVLPPWAGPMSEGDFLAIIPGVYTGCMDAAPVIWDEHNRRHIAEDHPERAISVAEVEEAMEDAGRKLVVRYETRE